MAGCSVDGSIAILTGQPKIGQYCEFNTIKPIFNKLRFLRQKRPRNRRVPPSSTPLTPSAAPATHLAPARLSTFSLFNVLAPYFTYQ
jgi:hypothetical protein